MFRGKKDDGRQAEKDEQFRCVCADGNPAASDLSLMQDIGPELPRELP